MVAYAIFALYPKYIIRILVIEILDTLIKKIVDKVTVTY